MLTWSFSVFVLRLGYLQAALSIHLFVETKHCIKGCLWPLTTHILWVHEFFLPKLVYYISSRAYYCWQGWFYIGRFKYTLHFILWPARLCDTTRLVTGLTSPKQIRIFFLNWAIEKYLSISVFGSWVRVMQILLLWGTLFAVEVI